MDVRPSDMLCRVCLDNRKGVVGIARVELERRAYSYLCIVHLRELVNRIMVLIDEKGE